MMVQIDQPAERTPFYPPKETQYWTTVRSPLGALTLLSNGEALTGLYLPTNHRQPPVLATLCEDRAPFSEAIRQIETYFDHGLTAFALPLAPSGSAFQLLVWQALVTIPYGETRSYGAVARLLGAPKAGRAVGQANARNPLALIVPCHRVIGSSGQLTGYASGLDQKQWLLSHEGAPFGAHGLVAAAQPRHSAPVRAQS